MWPRMKQIRLLCVSLALMVLWTTLLEKMRDLAMTGRWPGGGAETIERLCEFTSENRSACGTGAVARASALMPIVSRASPLPVVMLNPRLLLTTSSFRLWNMTRPFRTPRALTRTLTWLVLRLVWTRDILPVAPAWPRHLICMGKPCRCLENEWQRRRVRTAAGISMVIRPLLMVVPNVVWTVILAPLKFMLL